MPEEIDIKLGNEIEEKFPKGTTAADVLSSAGQLNDAIAARFEGRLVDLVCPLESSGTLLPVGPKDPEALEILRHSTSHIMAEAVSDVIIPVIKAEQPFLKL